MRARSSERREREEVLADLLHADCLRRHGAARGLRLLLCYHPLGGARRGETQAFVQESAAHLLRVLAFDRYSVYTSDYYKSTNTDS